MAQGRLTVRLHGCCPFHQMVSQFHGVGRAERKISRQTNDQDAHEGVLKDWHFGAKAEEEAGQEERGGEMLSGFTPRTTEERPTSQQNNRIKLYRHFKSRLISVR